MTLDDWLTRWSVPEQCLLELQDVLNTPTVTTETVGALAGVSETAVQQNIRVEASKRGLRLWRNNVGACIDENDRHIRYGLANDSKKMNKVIKSSDLIGITPHLVMQGDVGHVHGIFTSIEVKKAGWQFGRAKIGEQADRERAQHAWLKLVTSMGGFAKFATGVDDL